MKALSRLVAMPALLAGALLSGPAFADAAPLRSPDNNVENSVAAAILRSGVESGVVSADVAGDWNRCPAGKMCLFAGYNGTGLMAFFSTGSPDLRWQSIDDDTSSFWDRGNGKFQFYEGYNYTGTRGSAAQPGDKLNLDWGSYDNWYSSIRRV